MIELLGVLGGKTMYMHGLKIVPHQLAREVRDEWRVEKHPTQKRRRQWRVVKHHIDRPGAYKMGSTIYMHPELVDLLRSQTHNADVTGLAPEGDKS